MDQFFTADLAALRSFATIQQGVAGDIAAQGGLDTTAHVTGLTPVFGVIGADFLAAFAVAELLHDRDIGALSAAFANLAHAATTSANTLQRNDIDYADGLGTLAGRIGGQG